MSDRLGPLKHLLPASLRFKIRRVLTASGDLLHPGIPPSHLRSHISPLWLDFLGTGRDQLEFMVELAGLTPSQRILDIACGVGRLALPLSHYLDERGSYEGFDVFAPGIEWCQRHISSRRSTFQFQVAQLSTPWSLGRGPTAEQYRFPHRDGEFDLAYAGSIFTHLVGDAARNYLAESARVLKPGGRLVSTWLLYNTKAISLLPPQSIDKLWPRKLADCRAIATGPPEGSVLYDDVDVRSWFGERGFEIVEPFRVDATYNPARKPAFDRTIGMNLYHSFSIIAVKR